MNLGHAGFSARSARPFDPSRGGALLRHASGADLLFDTGAQAVPFAAVTLASAVCDDSGVAHVLEHLVFRGSRARPVADLYADLMLAGPVTDVNATTGAECTTYHLTSATRGGRDEALAVVLEALAAPLLTPEAFEQERAIIIGEMSGEWADTPRAVLAGLRAALFPATPHARTPGGLPQMLAALTQGEVRAFHRRFYRPQRMLLHLAGADPSRETLETLDAVLRLAPAAGNEDALPGPPEAPFVPPLALEPGSAALGIGWRLPGAGGLAARALHALVTGDAGPFADRRRWPVVAALCGADAPAPDLRLAFAPQPAEDVAQAIARAEAAIEAALPGIIAGLAARVELLADTLTAPSGLERHARLAPIWCRGGDPMSVPAPVDEIDALWRVASDKAAAEALVGGMLARLNMVCVSFGGGQRPATRAPDPRPRGPAVAARAAIAYRTPPPDPLPLPAIRHVRKGLHIAPDAGEGVAARVLALPLGGVAEGDLPLAGALVRHWASVGALVAEPVFGEAGAFVLLRASVRAAAAGRLDARLVRIFDAPLPEPGALPPPAPLPLHLRIDHRLRAAVCASGAIAQAMIEPLATDTTTAGGPGAVGRVLLGGACLVAAPPEPAAALLGRLPEAQGVAQAMAQGRPHMRLAPGEAVWPVPQGMGAAGMGLSLADEPALPLIAHALEWLWLRERIRREGGAYGVRCRAGAEGSLVFLSARDPDPRQSLVIFAESAAWLARELRGGLLERARRGMLERLARPLVGEEALARAFAEGVAGAATRAEVWRAVAEIDAAGVGRIAERLAAAMEGAPQIEARVSS